MRHAIIFAASVAALLAACGDAVSQDPAAPTAAGSGQPVETGAANAPTQKPAFAGQTRAPGVTSSMAVAVEVVASGLEKPWAVEPLADGRFLVTEKPGRLRIVGQDGQLSPPVAGVPAVDARGQGGLLDVALS
ncbi:MAG TPA: PQQ-dependent sugar dehydrogenase, partial [Caulobacteraceae bacterium]|nr:PQQ-dependent sugar dehydrogenase [Caulobacteraceae bacterium]